MAPNLVVGLAVGSTRDFGQSLGEQQLAGLSELGDPLGRAVGRAAVIGVCEPDEAPEPSLHVVALQGGPRLEPEYPNSPPAFDGHAGPAIGVAVNRRAERPRGRERRTGA